MSTRRKRRLTTKDTMDTMGVEPGAAGSREVAFRFVFVEALPAVHRRLGWPVEASQVEVTGLGDHGALESARVDRPIVRDRWSRSTC